MGNTCQTSTCFKVETVDTLEPNSPGATDDKKHTRLASFLFVVSDFLRLSFCVPSLETVSDFVKLDEGHKHCLSTRDCRTSREHQGGSELATSGMTFPLPSRNKGSWQPIIIRVASVTRRGKLPVGARRQESDSQELARKSVFDNAASHSTAFLLNSIHQSFGLCRFYTTAVGANARHPRPSNLFQTAANEGCNASRCEVRLFLHAEFDYRSRSTFTDEHEGWDDYFILRFCFAIKVIHIQVLLLEAPWALIVNIIAII